MTSPELLANSKTYLDKLCLEIPRRTVGSTGNRRATDFFASRMTANGFVVETPGFDCMHWTHAGAVLASDGERFTAAPSPYTLGCMVTAPLTVVSSVDELAEAVLAGSILLLHGEIAREQLMPKNFPFYNPEEHQQVIALLEQKQPQAIIAATTFNPESAGAVYPFPLIEDGDFDIPSVYMTESEGKRLLEFTGRTVSLEIKAQRQSARGCNVIARKGSDPSRRVVLFAHIDAKDGTPGATDNAASVVVLLLLADLLADYSGRLEVEIVAMNGEDYYAASGEKQYLQLNADQFESIILGINLDGVGFHRGKTAFSLYECSPEMAAMIRQVLSGYSEMIEGEAWYQGDHGLFLMNQVPTLAFTTELFIELLGQIAHTPKDSAQIVDVGKLVITAQALQALILKLDERT
jgi:aminopeptidase YwaD